jgi:hypothetical protein
MVSLDILEGLFGGPISCVPLVELPPLLAQPEKANAARRVRLSVANVDFSFVFMVEDRLVVRGAAGRDEDGGEDRQRHQRRAHPVRLSHRDDSAEDRIFRFHNFVILSAC